MNVRVELENVSEIDSPETVEAEDDIDEYSMEHISDTSDPPPSNGADEAPINSSPNIEPLDFTGDLFHVISCYSNIP